MRRWIACLLVLATTLLWVSCVKTMQTGQLRGLDVGSPLRAVSPTVLGVERFRDLRPLSGTADESRYLGAALGGPFLKADRPVVDVFADAVRAELRRNGHRVQAEGARFLVGGAMSWNSGSHRGRKEGGKGASSPA
jgi:hypothetical protein